MSNESKIFSKGYEYETLINMLSVSVSKHLLDEHFTLVWANDFYYELIGYPKEEYEAIFHNRCDKYYINDELGIYDEEAWNKIGKTVENALKNKESGYTQVSRMRRKNGDYIWVKMAGTFTQEFINGYQVSYTILTDISDIMQMHLEQSVTYDNLPGFVAKYRVSKDFKFTLLEANEQFINFFGEGSVENEEDNLYQQNLGQNFNVFQVHKIQLLVGEPVHFTVRMVSQYGNEAWLQINAICIDHQGDDPIYLVIYIDITNETELRQMQKKLEEQAQELRSALDSAKRANRAKSDFLSRMSHDIRTPMNAILGMTDIAAVHLDNPDKVRDCLKKISLSGQHLLGLINDVLDMSKIESGKMVIHYSSMSLPETLKNVIAIMQPQFKERHQRFSIRLRCVIHEQFYSDSLRLRQVFLNVLSNASKFTPSGGSITVDIKENEAIDSENAFFTFTFTDTGIGMQPDFLEHIFDSFTREQDSRVDKMEGTGLGMAITHKIIELLNGTIEVFSQPGEGSTFRIKLPLKINTKPFVQEKLPDLKIIVADDDDIMCEYTVEMLKTLGIYAEWVNNGAEAVERVEAAYQKGESYNAVILDWKMPGQDGIQTTRQIRKLCGNELPILIISAYDWTDIETVAKEVGVSGFIPKPLFLSTLFCGLQKYVVCPLSSNTEDQYECNEFSGKRFLLVEDNSLNREVASELLADTGAEIITASDGAQSVDLFQKFPERYYDLILMDIQMPVMNGYVATKKIREMNRKDSHTIPILAMTADAFAEDIDAAKEAGMNGHIAKPLDSKALKYEIKKYLF